MRLETMRTWAEIDLAIWNTTTAPCAPCAPTADSWGWSRPTPTATGGDGGPEVRGAGGGLSGGGLPQRGHGAAPGGHPHAHPDPGGHPPGAGGAGGGLRHHPDGVHPPAGPGPVPGGGGSGPPGQGPHQGGHRHEPAWACWTTTPGRPPARPRSCAPCPTWRRRGIFTHFANADGDEGYTMLQFTRFLDILAELEEKYQRKFDIRHCAASAAVLNYPCTHLDMVRPRGGPVRLLPRPLLRGAGRPGPAARHDAEKPGGGGAGAAGGHPGELRLHPEGAAGGRPGGGCCPSGTPTACTGPCPAGGACGWRGAAGPFSGRVCMDMCMALLEPGDEVRPGDVAEIFGPTCRWRSRRGWPAPSSTSCCAPSPPGYPGVPLT